MISQYRLLGGFILLIVLCALPFSGFAEEKKRWSKDDGYGIYISDTALLTKMFAEAEAELAKNPEDMDAMKAAGIVAHNIAHYKNDPSYIEKANTYLKKVVDKNRYDAVAMAHLGSTHAMMAREAKVVVSKISNVNKGMSLLNRAVRTAPDDFVVRMVRASVFYELPKMFKKPEIAIEDYTYAESRFDSLPRISNVEVPLMQAEVYYKLGMLKKSIDEDKAAAEYFQKAINIAPDSEWAKLAKKE